MSYWALPCCDNVKMRMGTLNCVQLTEKQSQGALWQDFPWCLKWFHLRFYYPRTGLMCPSIYLVNAQVNKIEHKTREQTLLSLHCFSADFKQKTGLDQQLLEEGLKTSVKVEDFLFSGIQDFWGEWIWTQGGIVACPFWLHAAWGRNRLVLCSK